jgi:hypothetical protein
MLGVFAFHLQGRSLNRCTPNYACAKESPMHVETAVLVPKAALRDPASRGQLAQEARTRLRRLGIAAGGLEEEPDMHVTGEAGPSQVVTVTFAWDTD